MLFFLNPGDKQFKVDTINEVDSWMESMIPDNQPPFYKIRLSGDDSELGMIVYPPYAESDFTNSDIEAMIEELLTYKGDTRKCLMKINCSGDSKYEGDLTKYSLQVEALYMINSLFFDDYTAYSPCQVLKDSDGNLSSTDGDIINKAFDAYVAWFGNVKEMGIGNARAEQLDPLKDTGIEWYK
ncbi:MAG: hypothetical protein AB8G11_07725 [Saprospiraceae bacterium]